MAFAVISDPFQLWAEIGQAASAFLSAVGIVLVIFKMFLDSHKANKALKREKLEKLQLSGVGEQRSKMQSSAFCSKSRVQ
jgi:hypothetical protein